MLLPRCLGLPFSLDFGFVVRVFEIVGLVRLRDVVDLGVLVLEAANVEGRGGLNALGGIESFS